MTPGRTTVPVVVWDSSRLRGGAAEPAPARREDRTPVDDTTTRDVPAGLTGPDLPDSLAWLDDPSPAGRPVEPEPGAAPAPGHRPLRSSPIPRSPIPRARRIPRSHHCGRPSARRCDTRRRRPTGPSSSAASTGPPAGLSPTCSASPSGPRIEWTSVSWRGSCATPPASRWDRPPSSPGPSPQTRVGSAREPGPAPSAPAGTGSRRIRPWAPGRGRRPGSSPCAGTSPARTRV